MSSVKDLGFVVYMDDSTADIVQLVVTPDFMFFVLDYDGAISNCFVWVEEEKKVYSYQDSADLLTVMDRGKKNDKSGWSLNDRFKSINLYRVYREVNHG